MDLQAGADWQMWVTLFIVFGAVVLYAVDRISLELVSMGVLVVLMLLFQFYPPLENGEPLITPTDLLAGFANPALFAILGLLIIGQGMFQSGMLERPTIWMLRAFERAPLLVIISVFIFVMLISAFLNNTPVVIMFIPILAAIANHSGRSPSRFMIPLSFVSILGGMTTLIGSSTNLLAAAAYEESTGKMIRFFDLTPMGLVLAVTGLVFLAFGGRHLLPKRVAPDMAGDLNPSSGKQFIAQIRLNRGHPLIGHRAIAGQFPELPEMTMLMIKRRDEDILPPFDEVTLRLHDVLVVASTRKALISLLKTKPEILSGLVSEIPLVEDSEKAGDQMTLVEAIVAPGSRMIGRTIAQIGFRYQTSCIILGVQRKSRMIRNQLGDIRLEAGDVLLILGDINHVRALRGNRDIVVLEYSMAELPEPQNAPKAAFIFALVIGSAALGLLPIAVSALMGATLLVATGCLNIRQAARAIDRRIYLLIGTALAMGLAIEKTGGAAYIGAHLVHLSDFGGPIAIVSGFFILTAILTNLLSNNATAVLFTPIAVEAAQLSGIEPIVLVMTVIYGANCSFATPVAYQTNLLVMAPGHYRFRDFLVIGLPMIILLWVVYSLVAPLYFHKIGLF